MMLKKRFSVIETGKRDNNSLLKFLSHFKNKSERSTLIIRSVRKLDKNFIINLSKHTDVRTICTVSSGYDNIDINACRVYGVSILNVFGGNVTAAAEHTMAVILAAVKNLIFRDSLMKNNKFDSISHLNTELYGKAIGVIGVGRIGSKVAGYAKAFGMLVIGNDINSKLKNKHKNIKFVSLNNLLKKSDIITVHTPLDDSTFHLLNKQNMKLLKSTAVLVNCSRGGTVDETALIDILKKNKIRYAGIDVFENEPQFNKSFTKLNNVLLTPHAAGKTKESKEKMAVIAAQNIIKHYKK